MSKLAAWTTKLAVLFCITLATDVDASSKRIRILVITALTGDAAPLGKSVANGAILAHESLAPELRSQIELIVEDDGMDPKRTISAYRQATAQHPVHAVLTLSAGTTNAILPATEREQTPVIALTSDPAVSRDRKFAVVFWVTPEEETSVLYREMTSRGYTKLAWLATEHPFGRAMRNAFDTVNAGRMIFAFEDWYVADVKDFRSYFTKLRGHGKVDAIVLALMPGQLGLFAKQAREAGVVEPLIGFEIFESSSEVEQSGGALLGSWFANAALPSGEFAERYRKRFPDDGTYGAANTYDAVNIIADAVKRDVSKPDSELRGAINDALHRLKDYDGATGKFSSTSDNRFTFPATLKVVRADGFPPLVSGSSNLNAPQTVEPAK